MAEKSVRQTAQESSESVDARINFGETEEVIKETSDKRERKSGTAMHRSGHSEPGELILPIPGRAGAVKPPREMRPAKKKPDTQPNQTQGRPQPAKKGD
jgi:hypothetical protein